MTCSLYSCCLRTGSLRLLFCEIRVKHGGRREIQFKNTEETPSDMSVPEYILFLLLLLFFKGAPVIGQNLWPGFEPLWLASDLSTCQSYAQALLICGGNCRLMVP